MVGGGGTFAVPGQPDPVREPQSLFSTPPPSFSMSTLLAALPSSSPDQIRQLQGVLNSVTQTPATHFAISAQLKAGETVCHVEEHPVYSIS